MSFRIQTWKKVFDVFLQGKSPEQQERPAEQMHKRAVFPTLLCFEKFFIIMEEPLIPVSTAGTTTTTVFGLH
jgi:hypothetical protein